MFVRATRTEDEFNAAIRFLSYAIPGWPKGTDRDIRFFRKRFAEDKAVCAIAEDTTGIVSASLATIDGTALVHADEYVSPNMDLEWYRSHIVNVLCKNGEILGAERLSCPSRRRNAELYEALGFAPTLFVQMYGADRDKWRSRFIEKIRNEYRVLAL